MKKIDPEFAYQSRELGAQIEDTLGDPPDRKYYAKVVKSLIDEFANGTEIDDVNLLSFAIADHLKFDDVKGLLAHTDDYNQTDFACVMDMISGSNDAAIKALTAVAQKNPALACRAIGTAFLYKHPRLWIDEDHSLESLRKSEEEEDEDEDRVMHGHDIEHLFDSGGEENV